MPLKTQVGTLAYDFSWELLESIARDADSIKALVDEVTKRAEGTIDERDVPLIKAACKVAYDNVNADKDES